MHSPDPGTMNHWDFVRGSLANGIGSLHELHQLQGGVSAHSLLFNVPLPAHPDHLLCSRVVLADAIFVNLEIITLVFSGTPYDVYVRRTRKQDIVQTLSRVIASLPLLVTLV